MDSMVALLDVIIWPITLLIIIFWFRKPLQNVFGRLNNLSASASGINVSFSEKLAEAKQKVFELSTKSISKDGPSINDGKEKKAFDFKPMINELKNSLIQKAISNNIPFEGKNAKALLSTLKEKGIVMYEKASLINTFLELSEASTGPTTDQEKKDVQMIFDSINL